MPEITVATFSVESDNVGITLCDIFGSNITNIGLLTALFMLLSPIKQIEKKKTIQTLSPIVYSITLKDPLRFEIEEDKMIYR